MKVPLILDYDARRPLVRRTDGVVVSQGAFAAQALALAARLPDAPAALNLCEDRHRFALAFAALLLRGQVNLLPPSAAPGVLRDVARLHPGCYALTDRAEVEAPCAVTQVVEVPSPDDAPASSPRLDASQVALIAYSSGTTGVPQGHPKTWGALVATAQLAARRFIGTEPGASIVATVPPQHMYGLETSVTLALAGGATTWGGRPFFPRDVADALHAVPAPRVLITTPLHLRACLAAGIAWPSVRVVVSATAPLDASLAGGIEHVFGTEVHEIFGCTEAGSMASRRTVLDGDWQLHPGMTIAMHAGAALVEAPHLGQQVPLQDQVEIVAPDRFRFLGRADDVLKVGGKRASLADLTRRLQAVPGVEDAVVFLPDATPGADARPAALVVAPAMTESAIAAALDGQVDPVFVPRPLVKVTRLPRNEVGKLPRAALLALLPRHG